ncbi:GntP family gluconate:H+ symporter [Kribbella voronezhensis]|uniref:GntP family gluconate:H+ symporter n=1 Tax=Kribbella voronezhensis TaxID=2512212 RepID=A0A4R7TH92_9ACTN|nr:gluconate:H+ symporter [Kribbella voronezhensis]TDU90847.1 GntP family gluconate:H+ symporter [Kribbella voronezhensis]
MSGAIDWLHHDTAGLLLLCLVAIALLLFLIIKIKLEPFISLLATGLFLALAAGLNVRQIVGTALKSSDSVLEKGFGGILGHIAVIIGLGTVLGALLERSGGADVLSRRLLRLFGPKGTPVAMGLVGLIFGIPVFFDIGIFVLAPLVYVAAKRGGKSLVLYALPVLAGLSMTHAFLPPHPGPTAVAGLLHVDMGWLIIIGLACGLPAFAVAGVLWPLYIAPRVPVSVPDEFVIAEKTQDGAEKPEPSLGLVLAVILLPLVLILGATFGTLILDPHRDLLSVLTFLGNPAVALLLAVLLAYYLLGVRRGMTNAEFSELSSNSLKPVGMILLVVGAGAFFGAVISATGVGAALATSLSSAGLPVLLLAYVISCGLRIAQGSATVAIVTTGGIVGPLLTADGYSQAHLALIAAAICAGSIILSHVNDGGFWIVAKYFNMTVKETLLTWSVLETVLSLVGFGMASLLWAII